MTPGALVQYSDSEDEFLQSAQSPIGSESQSRPNSQAQTQGEQLLPFHQHGSAQSVSTLPPALPDAFLDLYTASVRTAVVDDPTLHGGRQRTKSHVQGEWPSHVYIEWRPNKPALESLQRAIRGLQKDVQERGSGLVIHSLLFDTLGTPLPLHISLSRSLNLQTNEREGFLQSLRALIKAGLITQFSVSISKLSWVSNHEGNRWFLVAALTKPADNGLNKLLQTCNETAVSFGQPSLYHVHASAGAGAGGESQRSLAPTSCRPAIAARPAKSKGAMPLHRSDLEAYTDLPPDMSDHFHISIAWCLQEPDAHLQQSIRQIAAAAAAAVLRDGDGQTQLQLDAIRLPVNAVKIKIGNAVESIALAPR